MVLRLPARNFMRQIIDGGASGIGGMAGRGHCKISQKSQDGARQSISIAPFYAHNVDAMLFRVLVLCLLFTPEVRLQSLSP